MKLLLCYNPHSGKNRIGKNLDFIVSTLSQQYEVDVYESTAPKSISEKIKNLDVEYDVIMLCGGDGTVNEGINGIMMSKYRPKVAIIPTGTTNDFVNNFGIKKNIKKALDVVLNGYTKEHTIYKTNDVYFNYVNCMGMMTDITYQDKKKKLGTFSYYLRAIAGFFKSKHIQAKVKFDGKEVSSGKTAMVFMSNSNHACGYKMKKVDGKLSCVIIKGNRLLFAIQFGWYMWFHKAKHFYLCNEVEIETDAKEYNIDGEKGIINDNKLVIKPAENLTFFAKEKKKKK
ncbi:MAG: hypothetical protein K6E20_07205 [Acholeplasmatales bacterium]|nr:hypothetical protein [Acholeplasmatales bacterium]